MSRFGTSVLCIAAALLLACDGREAAAPAKAVKPKKSAKQAKRAAPADETRHSTVGHERRRSRRERLHRRAATATSAKPDPKQAQIVTELQRDYERLLRREDKPLLERALQHFEDSKQPSNWTDYTKGLALIRKVRAKASVPLLLKLMLAGGRSAHNIWAREVPKTLTILTGESMNYRRPRGYTELAEGWWFKKRDTITTDLDRMSKAQLRTAVDAMLGTGRRMDYSSGLADKISKLRNNMNPRHRHDRTEPPQDKLTRRAVEVMLERADDPYKLPMVVDYLAPLWKDSAAPGLPKVLISAKASVGARLATAHAMHRGGDDLPEAALLSILGAARKLEHKALAVDALQLTRLGPAGKARLLRLMSGTNRILRTAAMVSATAAPPPGADRAAMKNLKRGDYQEAFAAMQLLAACRTRVAKAALAKLLQAVDSGKEKRFNSAIRVRSALETATGYRDRDWHRKTDKQRNEAVLKHWRQHR